MTFYLAIENSNALQICGLLGAGFYIASYTLLQIGRLEGDSAMYILLNVAGALCVLLSLLKEFNLATAVIQLTFLSMSVVGIVRGALSMREQQETV